MNNDMVVVVNIYHFSIFRKTKFVWREKLEQPQAGGGWQCVREKMACSKKGKFDSENRSFKDEWAENYAFILPAKSSKPVCLICTESIAVVKSGNVKRHYETKHSNFENFYDPPRKSSGMFTESSLDFRKTQKAIF